MSQVKETLLIVDDETDLLDILAETLERNGRQILTASSAIEAIRNYLSPAAQLKTPIDCILSDMNMPQMTGLEFLMTYKSQFQMGSFVILTGFADKMKVVLGMKYGAYDFVEKPYGQTELLNLIGDAIYQGRVKRECDSSVQVFLKERGFPEAMKFKYHRKLLRLFQLELCRGTEGFQPQEFFSSLQAVKSFNEMDHWIFSRFKNVSSELSKKYAQEIKKLNADAQFIYLIRNAYHAAAHTSKTALSLGYESLGQLFELCETSLLFFRGFPHLITADAETCVVESLEACHQIVSQVEEAKNDSSPLVAATSQRLLAMIHEISALAYSQI